MICVFGEKKKEKKQGKNREKRKEGNIKSVDVVYMHIYICTNIRCSIIVSLSRERKEKHSKMSRFEIYSPEGLRVDGRRWNELRRFDVAINTHSHASDGSSYIEHGNNKLITLVRGPTEPTSRRQLDQTKATLDISVNITKFSKFERSKSSGSGSGNKGRSERRILEMQTSLVRTFEKNLMLHLYPRTVIEVEVHVLQQDGGLLGCLVNGITLACIDAGIAMYDYISGVSVGLYDTTPLLDINSLEEAAMSEVTLGVVGKSEKLSLLVVEDRIPLDRLESVLAIGIAGAHRIRDLMDVAIRKQAEKRRSLSLKR